MALARAKAANAAAAARRKEAAQQKARVEFQRRSAAEIPPRQKSAQDHWAAIRAHENLVSRALTSKSWSMVLEAVRVNDARLQHEREELRRRKEDLVAIDEQLTRVMSKDGM